MKKKLIWLLLGLILLMGACDNINNITGPSSNPPSTDMLQAIIGLNDHVTATWDSLLINVPYKVSSALSTGPIVRREFKVYRWRTGQLLFTDTSTILNNIQVSVDTLIFKLKVYGAAASDTSSATLNVRFLSQFGVGTSGDIQLLSYTPPNTYDLFLPSSRFPVSPPFNNPRILIFNVGGGLTTVNLTDPISGGWRYRTQQNSYDTLKFNYAADGSSPNIWSIATGSNFKSPGNDNAYTVKFVNGYIYNSSGGPSGVLVGSDGDTVMRFDVNPVNLIMYPNHRWISGFTGQAWNETNIWDLERRNHPEYGQTGYGYITVPIDSIRRRANQVITRFGSGNNVANMTASLLYSNGYLRFQFIGPANRSLIVGEEVQLLFENGVRMKLYVREVRKES